MKYQKQLDAIKSGEKDRAWLASIKEKAEGLVAKGDAEAKLILDAIDDAQPSDRFYVFMGFCPDANLDNRLDREWKEEGICYYEDTSQEGQMDTFCSLHIGDKIILKKQNINKQIMTLHGHGRIVGIDRSNELPVMKMNWSDQEEIIEIPLMGMTRTVGKKTLEEIQGVVPEYFFQWLDD
jgi:hypothetical protein